jgi:tetratricopeptide (TPR) repeat protein
MVSPIAQSRAPDDQELFRKELLRVTELNPKFAPAYVQLAKLSLSQGRLPLALDLARQAERLEPARAGYHLLSGQILLQMGRPADAAAHSSYVADRWGGPDHDEAMELWNSVPAEQRHAETPQAEARDDSTKIAEGVVKAVTCKDQSFAITLERAGESLTFRSQGFPIGFSDTLWVGSDHFTPCFQVNGLRAVVKYKAISNTSYTGDLLNVGFRDDLPPAPKAAAATGPPH